MTEIQIHVAQKSGPPIAHPLPARVDFQMIESETTIEYFAQIGDFDRRDLQVVLDHNRITVSGYHDQDQIEDPSEQAWDVEASEGDVADLGFAQSLCLPSGVEAKQIEVELYDGVLAIFVDKG
jgi:HSP20 family molecular chaperone IbpA